MLEMTLLTQQSFTLDLQKTYKTFQTTENELTTDS